MSHQRLNAEEDRDAVGLVFSDAAGATATTAQEPEKKLKEKEKAKGAHTEKAKGNMEKAKGNTSSASSLSTARLRVLSYNICWGCMEADKKDVTGMVGDLGRQCMQKANGGSRTICARNMGAAILNYDKQAGGYHLMAFQEASKFDDLGLGVTLPNMEKVSNAAKITNSRFDLKETKYAFVVSLYSKKKFGQHDAVVRGTLRSDDGRPFLIILFDKAQVVFINMHNCQPGHPVANPSWKKFLLEMEGRLKSLFAEKPERKKYRVILAGDFNDLKGVLATTLRVPWLGQKKLETVRPPKSCCTSNLSAPTVHFGDYIFDSGAPSKVRVVPSYNSAKAQSDHRPVEAELGNADGWSWAKSSSAGGDKGKRRRSRRRGRATAADAQTLAGAAGGAAATIIGNRAPVDKVPDVSGLLGAFGKKQFQVEA